MLEVLKAGGWKLIGIGQGELKALKSFARLNDWPGEFYSDMDQPKLPAFAALGANFKGDPTSCARLIKDTFVGCYFGIEVVWCRGCPPNTDLTASVQKNNFLVQSGIVAMDGGTTVFNQQQRAIDTPLPAEALVTALEKHGGVAPQNVQMTQ